MSNKEQIHATWAPPEALWSPWVKPVLFAFADAELETVPPRRLGLNTDWTPSSAVLIVDVPGANGVLYGLELARRGYRPIPLYNALPFPTNEKTSTPRARSVTAVEVVPILSAICRETEILKQLSLSPTSPPAFLLDADRRVARTDPQPGVFDNRSVCFETDFPSADFLLNHGLGTAIVVQEHVDIAGDLAQTLLAWQERGFQIFLKQIGDSSPPRHINVQRPSLLSRLWFRVSVALGLRRGELGAFGRIVPASHG